MRQLLDAGKGRDVFNYRRPSRWRRRRWCFPRLIAQDGEGACLTPFDELLEEAHHSSQVEHLILVFFCDLANLALAFNFFEYQLIRTGWCLAGAQHGSSVEQILRALPFGSINQQVDTICLMQFQFRRNCFCFADQVYCQPRRKASQVCGQSVEPYR